VVKGMSLAALLRAGLAVMTQMTGAEGVPRAMPLLYWLIGIALVDGSSFAARWLLWLPVRSHFAGRQVLIYGAGEAGLQLAASLRCGRDLFPAGFLDDDAALHGKDVGGVRVYAPGQLLTLIERFDIQDVIVILPSASSARRREVVTFLEKHPVQVRILPALTDIANGRHLVNMVREVDIGDLLGRDPVAAEPVLLGSCIGSKLLSVTFPQVTLLFRKHIQPKVPMVRDEGRAPYFLLDRGGSLVHIVNMSIIYPYKSWIYKVNETFSSSANSIEMAGPLSALLPPNLAWRSA
jgi:FlaA1/EpsC-like NDP-sugar epimerase